MKRTSNVSAVSGVSVLWLACCGVVAAQEPSSLHSASCHRAGDANEHATMTATTRETLRFDTLCAEEGNEAEGKQQDFAFFQTPCGTARHQGVVLGTIQVGGDGIHLALEEAYIAPMAGWNGARVALRLELTNLRSGHVVAGPPAPKYTRWQANTPQTEVPYTFSGDASFRFEQVPKSFPENITSTNASTDLMIDKATIGDASGQMYHVNLIVNNLNNNETLCLEGPALQNVQAGFELPKPEMRVLGFLDTLNPNKKGNLWSSMKADWRYNECKSRRKEKIQEFYRRWDNL